MFLWCSTILFRRTLDINAVFIGPCQKIDVETALLLVAVYHIGNYRRVQMAQMGKAVRIIDRRCDVKSVHPKKDKV